MKRITLALMGLVLVMVFGVGGLGTDSAAACSGGDGTGPPPGGCPQLPPPSPGEAIGDAIAEQQAQAAEQQAQAAEQQAAQAAAAKQAEIERLAAEEAARFATERAAAEAARKAAACNAANAAYTSWLIHHFAATAMMGPEALAGAITGFTLNVKRACS